MISVYSLAMLKGLNKDREKVGKTVTVAEKFTVKEKHRKASQGRKDRITLRETAKRGKNKERKRTGSQKGCQAVTTDKQEFVLASS